MKSTFAAILFGLAIGACTTATAPEAAPAADAAAAPEAAAAEAVQPECDPADESCDTGGTEFRPPTR